MNKQNITLALPKTLLKKAKIMAASLDKSLSEFLKETLEEKIKESNGYKTAKARQLKLLKTGFNLGTEGKIAISREDLHARK